MLDKRCLSVLEYIDKQCLNCGYKVFEIEEILSSTPKEYGLDKENVVECLKTLSEHGYISVKYIDELEVCLSPLSKGRLVFENRLDTEIQNARAEKRYFRYSFLGAVCGSGFICLVVFFILFFLRLFNA